MTEEEIKTWFENTHRPGQATFTLHEEVWHCAVTNGTFVCLGEGATRDQALHSAIENFNRTHCGAV